MDKTSGGSVTQTRTYYPAAGAMRIGSTLYYMLKDHLGSASVTTNASGVTVSGGEQRYYPFGENCLTATMLTDKLFTGQREITGLGIYHYQARFYSPKLGRFLSPDTIISGVYSDNLNRYSYVLGNPLKYTDPTGHMVSDDNGGGLGVNGYKYVIEKKFGAKVKGKWSQKEINTLYNTLGAVLQKFDNNIEAYHNAFGSLTFEMLPDIVANLIWDSNQMGESDYASGVIQFRHSTIPWSEGYYGAGGWSIAHEMGHIFDTKGANGNPQLYFSNVFVDVFNNSGCAHLGPNGCLGTEAWTGYVLENGGQGKGDYVPSGSTTPYGYLISSTEDYAEGFAAYIFNNTIGAGVVDDDRKNIIQVDIAVMVSYSP